MIPALRDVSLVILIVPMMICLLIPMAILFGGVLLMRKSSGLRPKLQSVHRSMREIDRKVDRAGQRIVSPFISLEVLWIRLETFLRGLRRERTKS